MDSSTVQYGFDYLSYYYYYLYDIFVGFSLIVKISVMVVLGSALFGIFLLFYLTALFIEKHHGLKIMHKIEDKYAEKARSIGQNTEYNSPEEIALEMDYDRRKPLNTLEKRWFIQMLVDIKADLGNKLNKSNFHNIIVAFGLPRFFESELQFSRTRYRVSTLTWVRFLEESISGAVIIPLLYSKNRQLRKAAQDTFMWSSQSDPFRFFDNDDFAQRYRGWDGVEIHSIFEHRRQLGMNIPDMSHWVKAPMNESTKSLFVSEIRYLNKKDECPFLVETFNTTDNKELRKQIALTWGELRYAEAEQIMIDSYKFQPESVKQAILQAVSQINSGKALQFLQNAYTEATDFSVKFNAAKSLYGYGLPGRRTFSLLRQVANERDAHIFEHISDPLINNRKEEVVA